MFSVDVRWIKVCVCVERFIKFSTSPVDVGDLLAVDRWRFSAACNGVCLWCLLVGVLNRWKMRSDFKTLKLIIESRSWKEKKNKREITVDSYLEIQWVLKLVRASQVIKILALVALWQQYNDLWCTTLHRVLQTWFLPGRNVMLLDKWTILEVLIIVLENWSIPDVILFIFLTQNLWLFPDESSFLLFFLCRWKTKRHNVFFLFWVRWSN